MRNLSGICMKKRILAMLFCFVCLIIYADEDYYLMEAILINRGYTKFDPKVYFDSYIYADCYNEIFNEDIRFVNAGLRRIRIAVGDGFEYILYYVLEKEELPNILVIVHIEIDGKVWGFYKKNLLLGGTIMYIDTTGEESILVFF